MRTKAHLTLLPEGATDATPEIIGSYRLGPLLGGAGHPGLRLAERTEPEALAGRYAALVLPRAASRLPSSEAALLRAAVRSMGCRHPALVRVRDVTGDSSHLVIVTDLWEGVPLDDLLATAGPRGVERGAAIGLMATLLDALHDIHLLPRDAERSGLPAAHGEVRAGNIAVDEDGRVRLLGFGLPLPRAAFTLDDDMTSMTSDELWFPTPAADQFAAGLLLLRLAGAVDPLLDAPRGHGPPPATIRAALASLDVSDPLLPIALTLLASRPEHRYPDAGRAAEQLRRLLVDTELLPLVRLVARRGPDQVPPPRLDPPRVARRGREGIELVSLDLDELADLRSVDFDAPLPQDADLISIAGGPNDRADLDLLGRPSREWRIDDDDDEELARTLAEAPPFDPAGAPPTTPPSRPRATSEPGRTVPFSPAFVPRSSSYPAPSPAAAPAPPSDWESETRAFQEAPNERAPWVPVGGADTAEIPQIARQHGAPPPTPARPRRRRRKPRQSALSQEIARRGGLVAVLRESVVASAVAAAIVAILAYGMWGLYQRTHPPDPTHEVRSPLLQNLDP